MRGGGRSDRSTRLLAIRYLTFSGAPFFSALSFSKQFHRKAICLACAFSGKWNRNCLRHYQPHNLVAEIRRTPSTMDYLLSWGETESTEFRGAKKTEEGYIPATRRICLGDCKNSEVSLPRAVSPTVACDSHD